MELLDLPGCTQQVRRRARIPTHVWLTADPRILTMRLATDPSRGPVVVVTLRRKVPTWHQE